MLKKENIIRTDLTPGQFDELALDIFKLQASRNKVYSEWLQHLKLDPDRVKSPKQIPFLPIEFFKSRVVVSSALNESTIKFTSSATTSQVPAAHYVNDISVYQLSFTKAFDLFYGNVQKYCVLALLPNYLRRTGSSLVYMCNNFIQKSTHPFSGFFLDNIPQLLAKIGQLKNTDVNVLLIGVSYALIDLCDTNITLSSNFTVMETGGMKGTRKEMLKPELHEYLRNGFGIERIHSEYGMTELLSQAYSRGDGFFEAPPWMRFYIREVNDPLNLRSDQKTGGINVIDLANFNSCSFIATKDLGRLQPDGRLELMGRYDNSDVRGCNLMMGEF